MNRPEPSSPKSSRKPAFSSRAYRSASRLFISSYTGMWKVCMILYGTEAKIRSALSVVMPFLTACSEYRPPNASSISESEGAMWVDERWIIVTSAPCSHRSAQMSCAELLEPSTTQCLPAQAAPPGCWLEWCCVPSKVSAPGILGTLG